MRTYDPALLQAWRQGAAEFNSGRYWEAHEKWEQGWKSLPEPERSWVQAWIQLAGAIFLLQKGREVPARALCVRALARLDGAVGMSSVLPRLEIEGGAAFLRENGTSGSRENSWKLLKAKLLSDPGL